MGTLDGKVAIVTGAARGQGEAEARLFVAEGAKVMLTDVLPEGGAVAEALGDLAAFSSHDVSSAAGLGTGSPGHYAAVRSPRYSGDQCRHHGSQAAAGNEVRPRFLR